MTVAGSTRHMVRRGLEALFDVRIDRRAGYDLRLFQTVAALRPWRSGDVVFDVGANDGRTVERLMRHLPAPRIFALEPVDATFKRLQASAARYAGVTCIRSAAGSVPGEAEIYLDASPARNSLRRDWTGATRSETVPVDTLDAIAARHDIDHIHFLKIDTEGHDLEVLKGAQRLLGEGRISIIQVEAGLAAPGPPQPTLGAFQALLRRHGLYLFGIFNQSQGWRDTGYPRGNEIEGARERFILVHCDALFVSARAADIAQWR